jgi:hypothetical protein
VKPVPAKEKVSAALSLALPGQRFVADYFNADPELAARATLDSSLLYGIETLCDNKRAFVNCTREVLFKDLITLLPPSQTVAEILETVEPEDFSAGPRSSSAAKFPPAACIIYGCSKWSAARKSTSISYRLLRYLNSPIFRFVLELKSIRHAMAVRGEREMRRWVRLVVTVGAAEQKCSELILMGLARARKKTENRHFATDAFRPHFSAGSNFQ